VRSGAVARRRLANYPATGGTPELKTACATWLQRRYGLALDPATQILPVNGSREALFALAQVVVNPRAFAAGEEPVVVCPNPFYQIYEGAAYLAGAQPWFAPSDPARNFAVDWANVPDEVWRRTQLLYTCSPGNPTGAVMPLQEWEMLFELSDRHGFVIASDECYSEIYFRDEPPWAGWKPPHAWVGTTSATSSRSPACPSAATCQGCAAASWPATPTSSSLSCSTAPTTAAP